MARSNITDMIINAIQRANENNNLEEVISVVDDIVFGLHKGGRILIEFNSHDSEMHKAGIILDETCMYNLNKVSETLSKIKFMK